jgi:hypothetical protein
MKNFLSKLMLLTIPLFVFIIYLVIHNQHKVNVKIAKQTKVFNQQFNSFNRQFGGNGNVGGGGSSSPRRRIVRNNKQLNRNINKNINQLGGF